MQPEEIKHIRAFYGINAKFFSRIFGWGDITMTRYETGRVEPSPANLVILKIIKKHPEWIRYFYEETKDRFHEDDQRYIDQKLEQSLGSGQHVPS